MISKVRALDYPLPGEARSWRDPGERELWNAEYPWNWVLLGSVLGCLLFWAFVVWGILSAV